MSTLSVKNGFFSYSLSRRVLNDISYKVSSGELVAILGPNGAGKTTLLKCTMGLLGWRGGKSELNGKAIDKMTPRELFSQVAYVPQAKANTPSYLTEEMVLLGLGSRIGLFRQPTKDDVEKAISTMERLGIEYLKGKRCSEISGGELQMVLIARAMVGDPAIIVLDEPESNLDFKNQLMVMETLSSLKKSGVACLFNTHFPSHALQYADKALMLGKDGKALFGEVDEIITEPNVENFFGVRALISEIATSEGLVRDVVPLSLKKKEKTASSF